MRLSYRIVDAFTEKLFGGNPAAVIIMDGEELEDAQLQLIAREFNLSETSFLSPIDKAKGSYKLRWFTPSLEAPICGHATLAAAYCLFSDDPALDSIDFESRYRGILRARRLRSPDDQSFRIELDFPVDVPKAAEAEEAEKIISAHRRACPELAMAKILGAFQTSDGTILQVELDASQDLQNLKYDASQLTELYGIMEAVTTRAPHRDAKHNVHSRVFCPNAGINEDPVTGSMHCALAPLWQQTDSSERYQCTSTRPLRAFQASTRGGTLELVIEDERCKIRGSAVTVAEGVMSFQ